ncbi:peroxisomal membrane protein 11C isoform X1 [Zalophus californianus]|uniref:Peroxisomal membrane protein 11C isoform X1 n=1 Tax=Zalophus californianus TaxID=9704 RepID=A0A6J2C475_ZALCA|nr:peroxisomal membrane protein 11C isoform X1 [Zalophus californianus]
MAALSGLASALESYRGRDRLIRTLGYCCQLVGGVLVERCPARSEVGTRLLTLSSQLSHCRTVLRLFDDVAMFIYTKQYGLGAEEEDSFVRCVSVLGNLADQLYYPCEHIAWAADAQILHVDPARWWTLSTAFWGLSLLLGIARSLRMVLTLRRKLRGPAVAFTRYDPRVLPGRKADFLPQAGDAAGFPSPGRCCELPRFQPRACAGLRGGLTAAPGTGPDGETEAGLRPRAPPDPRSSLPVSRAQRTEVWV